MYLFIAYPGTDCGVKLVVVYWVQYDAAQAGKYAGKFSEIFPRARNKVNAGGQKKRH